MLVSKDIRFGADVCLKTFNFDLREPTCRNGNSLPALIPEVRTQQSDKSPHTELPSLWIFRQRTPNDSFEHLQLFIFELGGDP